VSHYKLKPGDSVTEFAAFDELMIAGCERETLTRHLSNIEQTTAPPGLPTLQGGTARERRAKLDRIRRAAKDIRELQQSFAGRLTTRFGGFAPTAPNLPGEAANGGLAEQLEAFANLFEDLSKNVRNPRYRPRDIAIAALAAYVQSVAGDAHDSEVSVLIATLPGCSGYTLETHKVWKARHKRLVQLMCRPWPAATNPHE
jgi:hypothetical protein